MEFLHPTLNHFNYHCISIEISNSNNMKTLILSACMAFSAGAFAQSTEQPTPVQQQAKNQKRNLTPEDKAIRALRMVISQAGISDAQTPAVKQILLDRENAKASVRKANKGDKEKIQAEIANINSKADEKLQATLTPEQWKRWVSFKAEHEKKKAAKRAEAGKDATGSEEDFY
jgi:hypothetical protein